MRGSIPPAIEGERNHIHVPVDEIPPLVEAEEQKEGLNLDADDFERMMYEFEQEQEQKDMAQAKEIINEIKENPSSINNYLFIKDRVHLTAAHVACGLAGGAATCLMAELITRHIDLNKRTNDKRVGESIGQTPLYLATEAKHLEVVEMIIGNDETKTGVDLLARSSNVSKNHNGRSIEIIEKQHPIELALHTSPPIFLALREALTPVVGGEEHDVAQYTDSQFVDRVKEVCKQREEETERCILQ